MYNTIPGYPWKPGDCGAVCPDYRAWSETIGQYRWEHADLQSETRWVLMYNTIPGYPWKPGDCGAVCPDYRAWSETIGQYRWEHADGSPRTYYPLEWQWQRVYDAVTQTADLYFMHRNIEDVLFFTDEFLARVPLAWEKFKTELELLSGTLDGTNIDPEIFTSGYDREFTRTQTQSSTVHDTSTGNIQFGERIDSEDSTDSADRDGKARDIQYQQGVQAYDGSFPDIGSGGNDFASGMVDHVETENQTAQRNGKARDIQYQQGVQAYDGSFPDIGSGGNDFASGMVDHVETENQTAQRNTTAVTGAQTNKQQVDGTTAGEQEIGETEREKVRRINYYDNLAFLRDRIDRLDQIKPFYSYFLDLFTGTESMQKAW